jgi:hypothetical protein
MVPWQVALAATTDTVQRPEAQAFITTALALSTRNARIAAAGPPSER